MHGRMLVYTTNSHVIAAVFLFICRVPVCVCCFEPRHKYSDTPLVVVAGSAGQFGVHLVYRTTILEGRRCIKSGLNRLNI